MTPGETAELLRRTPPPRPSCSVQPPRSPAPKPRRQVIRQYELVERVKAYDPDADEDLLNRAYVFAMKAHGAQLRASGDPYFHHPVEVAGILTGFKLDSASIATALLHDTVEDTGATLEEIERLFGAHGGPAGRRRHQAQPARAAVGAHRAGREFPQAAAGDVRGHPRAAGQARRPAAQHAHAAFHQEPRQAAAHRRRDHGDLRAAGRADRDGDAQGRARGPGLRRAVAGRARERPAPPAPSAPGRRRPGRPHRGRADPGAARRPGSRPRSSAGRRRRYSIWRKMERKNVSFEQLSDIMAFRVHVDSLPTCYAALGVMHGAYHMLPGPLQGFHQHAQAQWLPLAAHHDHRPGAAQDRGADPHPRHARAVRARGGRALGLQAGHAGSRGPAVSLDPRAAGHPRARRRARGVSREHQARDVPGPGVLLHAQGRPDRPAARRHAGRFRLRRPFAGRRPLRRRQDRRPDGAAAQHSCRTATRSRSSPAAAARRRPNGSGSSSPARPGRGSAAICACASATSIWPAAATC